YAPEPMKYPIDRYAMETKRLFSVANNQLEKNEYLAGNAYTIADIAAYTWLSSLFYGGYKRCDIFLQLDAYTHVARWLKQLDARPGVMRGRLVNTAGGLRERHSAADFATLDKSILSPVRTRPE